MSDTEQATDWKNARPQNKNLIPLTERSLEEALEIRRKGQAESRKVIREKAHVKTIVRQVLAMGYNKGAVADPEKISNLQDALAKNVPIQTLIVMHEVEKYLTTGDIESRNWLFKYAFPDDADSGDGLNSHSGIADSGNDGAGVRVHLIRGEKPADGEDAKATPPRGASSEPLSGGGGA